MSNLHKSFSARKSIHRFKCIANFKQFDRIFYRIWVKQKKRLGNLIHYETNANNDYVSIIAVLRIRNLMSFDPWLQDG
jgi:hypothetical protein